MGKSIQTNSQVGKPFSVGVELALGCSRLCSFCGLTGVRDKPGNYRFMTVDTAINAARELGKFCPSARIEFAMHGEPLMNPGHLEIFSLFRAQMPETNIMLTTNGNVLMKSAEWMQRSIDRIFSAGIDFIVLDTYYPERDKLRALAAKLHNMTVWDFYDYCIPNNWSPWHNHHRKQQRTVILLDDLGKRDGEHGSRVVYNMGGNVKGMPWPAEPLVKTCTNPFRELIISWDGGVQLCCMDWAYEATMGNVNNQTLPDIWWGKRFEAYRTALQNKDRRMTPCSRCDKNSGPRAGLLPKYGPITPQHVALIQETIAECKPINGAASFCDVQPGTRK